MSLLNWEEKNWTACSRCALTGAEQSRKITSLHLPAAVLLIQPRMLLAFLAARIHGWLMFSLLPAKTPCAFSAEQLSSQPVPTQLVLLFGIIPSQVQDLMFISAEPHVKPHSCWPNLNSLLRSLYMVAFTSSTSTSSPSLGSSSNVVTVHSTLPSRSFIKLKYIDSRRN